MHGGERRGARADTLEGVVGAAGKNPRKQPPGSGGAAPAKVKRREQRSRMSTVEKGTVQCGARGGRGLEEEAEEGERGQGSGINRVGGWDEKSKGREGDNDECRFVWQEVEA